jgi:ubiquinone/menaquinone biosynthesis C-methylase UbiE
MLQFDENTAKLLETAYQGADVSRRRRMALDALHLEAGEVVVDIGCGNGFLTQEIARTVGPSARVISVDPNVDMRAPAQAR